MQINRLFEIVYLLMDKKSMTAMELAAHFEVSKRTVLRDIDTLTAAGIPIYTTQGKGGGISILDNFVINKTVISDDEQNQILFALQAISTTRHVDTDNLLGRLQCLFEKTNTDWIEVDFSRWAIGTTDKAKFDSLKKAIINNRAISFSYSSYHGETNSRKVYPLKLAFKSKSWYLRAFCLLKNDYRTFKINRMRDVEMLADKFDGKAFQVPEIEPSDHQSPLAIDVKLHFAPQVAYRVYDDFNEQNIFKNEDGSFTVAMSLPNDSGLYDYILSFGTMIEAIEPQIVRDEIIRQTEKIKNKYLSKT